MEVREVTEFRDAAADRLRRRLDAAERLVALMAGDPAHAAVGV
jgi:hypothetical protein